MSIPIRWLGSGFLRSEAAFGDRPALMVAGRSVTYQELGAMAKRIAAAIQSASVASGPNITAILASRSLTAFSGVLGATLAGGGYMPLNLRYPPQRNRSMLSRAGCTALVVDAGGVGQLEELLEAAPTNLLVILPDPARITDLSKQWPKLNFISQADLPAADRWHEPDLAAEDLAYLLFTSGSTGQPKGVMVSHGNVRAFLDYVVELYGINETDRLSQLFDLTFDLSIFDLFVAWERGASVFCPSQKTLIKPDQFVIENELTVWFSTPSTAALLKQFGALRANRFPTLRLSLFCGEPLPVSLAQAWAAAAPNSLVENLYGPTELTIACTRHRWDSKQSPAQAENGIAPIGAPFPGMRTLVVDAQLEQVRSGEVGELLMCGSQMSQGYLEDRESNARAFVIPPGKDCLYYRTGDLVRCPTAHHPLVHLGRIDNQIKILGHRAELGEIEDVVRKASGFDSVVAIGWPRTQSGYGGVEVFIEGSDCEPETIRTAVASILPSYMAPRRYHLVRQLPRNASSKIDRSALIQLLESGEAL